MFKSLSVVLCFFCAVTSANNQLYGVFSLGYADVSFAEQELSAASYKLSVGYQIHPQWYAEFGYQQLADEEIQAESGIEQGDALYAAVLGKAGGRSGELFYRVGVAKLDFVGKDATDTTGSCEVGQLNPDNNLCLFDEGSIGGLFGIGFDFFISPRSMVRTEVEYLKGENGFETAAAYVGLRHNF